MRHEDLRGGPGVQRRRAFASRRRASLPARRATARGAALLRRGWMPTRSIAWPSRAAASARERGTCIAKRRSGAWRW